MNPGIQHKLQNLPLLPGVYLYKNDKGKVIYVGKARILRNRVKSYFTGGPDGRAQYEALVESIDDLEVIITETEVEALILEANLIKRYRPKFNVFFRDDKFFPFLKVTKEPYPRAFLTRKVLKDGSEYHGPFTEVGQVRRLIKIFKGAFQIRNCNLDITPDSSTKHKVCLDYHIGLCGGPCEGLVNAEDYRHNVRRLLSLVKGNVSVVVKELKGDMNRASVELRFEEAAVYRDRLKVVEEFAARQTIIFPDNVDRDVFGLAREDDDGCVALIKVREGRVQGREHFYLKGSSIKTEDEIISSFIKQYYYSSDFVPRELFLPVEPEDKELLIVWLRDKRNGAVEMCTPKRGNKIKLLRLAAVNAELLLGEKRRETESRDRIPHSLKALQESLDLPNAPRTIEAFDISNISGTFPVASMVFFRDGKPVKSQYRRFNIKTVEGVNDFAMMAEAVKRRYSRLLKEEKELPDLILVDGGKGQLSAAFASIRDLGITDLPIIGLAKRLEEVYTPFDSMPYNLPKTSSALRLLQRIRDEAHRFAIVHHRTRRERSGFKSTLDSIPGVGEMRKKILLKHFGSIKRIASASADELSSIDGIDKRTVQAIRTYFLNYAEHSK
ncbi:MAG: excinuclease ABC subunit C [candidate division Zixibacteria bacterium]|nr:excinuclease ABC subunit C [Candidatus Tariuqbacter arcticus]